MQPIRGVLMWHRFFLRPASPLSFNTTPSAACPLQTMLRVPTKGSTVLKPTCLRSFLLASERPGIRGPSLPLSMPLPNLLIPELVPRRASFEQKRVLAWKEGASNLYDRCVELSGLIAPKTTLQVQRMCAINSRRRTSYLYDSPTTCTGLTAPKITLPAEWVDSIHPLRREAILLQEGDSRNHRYHGSRCHRFPSIGQAG